MKTTVDEVISAIQKLEQEVKDLNTPETKAMQIYRLQIEKRDLFVRVGDINALLSKLENE